MPTPDHRRNRRKHERAVTRRWARAHSNGNGAAPAGHEGHDPDDNVGIIMGVAETPADVPEAQQQTHDTLIKFMGDRRTGPVTWSLFRGQDAIYAIHRIAAEGTTLGPNRPAYLERFAVWPEAVLVVASAPGTPGFDDVVDTA